MKNIKINKITTELINSFKSLYPFDVIDEKDIIEIELSHDKREIWAFPLVAGTDYIDTAIRSIEEHRKVIPAALNRCKDEIEGAFFVGYYAKKIKEDELEHGLVIIPANRECKEKNKELLTDYCFERENLYSKMFSETYFQQIKVFLKTYSSVCKKYWIQDTRLMNTEFIERPVINSEDLFPQQAATSTWHTEVYPDFMRPVSMIGDIYIDFMLINHNFVCLNKEFDEEDSIWEFFEEEKINDMFSMPSIFSQKIYNSVIKSWCETTDYELSSRKDFDYKTIYDIAVPSLKGTIIDQGYSIGWCGKIALMGIGLDKPLYVSPNLIRPIDELEDFDKVANDNKAFWRNRDIDYRKKVSKHKLIKVCDNLMLASEAKIKLIEAAEVALQTCKKPFKEVQKGINKFVTRYLKGLARGDDEIKALDFLEKINNVKICADEQEVLCNIISWAKQIENFEPLRD